MSVPDPALTDHLASTVAETVPAHAEVLATALQLLVLPVQVVAFWTAALLPLTYLPLLATGVVAERPLAFVALLALNLVAFVVGHSYNQPDPA